MKILGNMIYDTVIFVMVLLIWGGVMTHVVEVEPETFEVLVLVALGVLGIGGKNLPEDK